MKSVHESEDKLSRPSDRLVEEVSKMDGDILILGVGGKMGPSLAKLAKRAINQAGVSKKVIGVSRFSKGNLQQELENEGIQTIAADLLNEQDLNKLPKLQNVIYMAGNKFGTSGNESFTWAMNAYLPGKVAETFKDSNIVAFSTGNVYPLTSVNYGGSTESSQTNPIGEYAQSCLGRERIFEHFSKTNNTPTLIFRLNYAIDLRYGVLMDIAESVYQQKPINLSMGNANVIWQGDANDWAIRSLNYCSSPAKILNVTGPETLSVRYAAEEFGKQFNKVPIFINEESDRSLLSNAAQAFKMFGYPSVTLAEMIDWTANWVKQGGETLNKPSKFQEREGAF
ncbi:epimerase [Fictibacillus arsenicus]|uniref:Epimerase n=1 Tax=Fictibacillus arsenicus TaxID=255247 RepID=A0A1B1Z9B5_9BACL|nr:NAD-dependent epimerase/dehydratase family protein [Fictibacillus arsenicus]ANX13991.1 epimerase [Fictibacillus arsenicus]